VRCDDVEGYWTGAQGHRPRERDRNFLRPCDSNDSAGRGPMSTLGIERFRGERGGAMEKRKSPLLRWTEETERGRVLEFPALRACERVWPAERMEPSVKARVSDCQPRWRTRIPLLASAASRSTGNLTQ
jgi:hypothetical protein